MTLTRRYSSLHAAFASAASAVGVEPFVARVCLAVHDRGGKATSSELAHDLWVEASSVRRALLAMYERGLAEGRGVDGGPRRPGTVTEVKLTSLGASVAARVVDDDAHEFPLAVAA